jgi:hypothetical protein
MIKLPRSFLCHSKGSIKCSKEPFLRLFLGQYQRELGSFCANCRGAVMSSSMGKYCVRFGFNVRQFCSSTCLEEFKKGLKVCSYCQRDITGDVEGFLAPIGDKGQFKVSQACFYG